MPGIKTKSQIEADRAVSSGRVRARLVLEDEDLVRLMRAEWGRRIVARLLKNGRNRSKNFDTHSLTMARHVGVADFVQVEIVDRIFDLCPETYAPMMRENP